MEAGILLGEDWASLAARLPAGLDLEVSARAQGALQRRRGVPDAAALLRLALVYGGTELGLRGVAAWARGVALADLSDVALLYRLQGAEGWLGWVLRELLSAELAGLAARWPLGSGRRLRLIDATSMAAPGGVWRVHASFDLAARRFDHLELTSDQEGESLARIPAGPGEVLIADRGYAHARGLHHAAAQGADFIVHRGLSSCRLLRPDGTSLTPETILALARKAPRTDLPVLIPPPPEAPQRPPLEARLIIARKPEEAIQRARRQALRKAQTRGQKPSDSRLEAAEHIMLMTTLSAEAVPAKEILALYRLRWQIELAPRARRGQASSASRA